MAFSILNASVKDMQYFIDSAKAEGWNPGIHDTLPFHAQDPGGFFIGRLNHQSIGCISAVRYPNSFAFLGFYIVNPEFRGRGFGMKLWQHAMNFLTGFNIGLDGVITKEEDYRRSHFKTAHHNIRFKGKPCKDKASNTIDALTLPFEMIAGYDRKLFPSMRDAFLSNWLQVASKSRAIAHGDKLSGYGVMRKCYQGYKIGPLFANDSINAETILCELCKDLDDSVEVYIDVPETNSEALQLVQGFNFEPVFETVRMYTQSAPEVDHAKIFGISSFELG